jgi:glutaredoxin-like YruB-family protein
MNPKNKKVVVYSTSTCPYCVYAKDFFKKNDVSFEDKNVGIDRLAGQEMVTKSGQMGVPVIEIDGEIVVGFQPEVFEKLLSK